MKKLFLILISVGYFTGNLSAQHTQEGNSPSKTNSRTPLPEGPDVWGAFEGRVPCHEMAKAWNLTVTPQCEKLKWAFVFFQDPKTHAPTTYKHMGSLFRGSARVGKWALVKGTPAYPNATVIQLDPDHPETSVFLLKGDDNVLFILDKKKNLMVGDSYLGYTFSRAIN